jgi:hypothetical protein
MKIKFPNAYKHFQKYEPELNKRVWFDKSAVELHGEFYAMMYFDPPEEFENAKIVSPALTDVPNFTINHSGATFVGGTAGVIGIIPKVDPYVMLGILNSFIFRFYMPIYFPDKENGWFQISEGALVRFPFPNIEDVEDSKLTQLHNVVCKMIDLNKNLGEAQSIMTTFGLGGDQMKQDLKESGFISNIQTSGKVDNISLDDKIVRLNDNSHVECKDNSAARYVYYYLTENRKSVIKNKADDVISKIRIFVDIDDVRNEVEKYEKAVSVLQGLKEIEHMDHEIDMLVAQLYDLNESEIDVIMSHLD